MNAARHNRRSGRVWGIALILLGLMSGLFSCGCLGSSISLVVFLNTELSRLRKKQSDLARFNETLQMSIAKDRLALDEQLFQLRLEQKEYATLLERFKLALPESREVVKLIRQNLEDKRAEEQKAITKLKEIKERNAQTVQEWQEKTRQLEVEGKEWSVEESNRVRKVLLTKYDEILKLERELAKSKTK